MKMFHAPAFGLALALLAPAAFAQAPAAPPAPPQAIKEVKPGLYMITGGGGNAAVRVTSDGLVVVDSKSPGLIIGTMVEHRKFRRTARLSVPDHLPAPRREP